MGRRPYSIIRKADELKEALNAYETWKRRSAAEKQAIFQTQKTKTQNPKTARSFESAYLRPFNIPLNKNVWIECKVPVSTAAESGQTESENQLITDLRSKVVTPQSGGFTTTASPPTGSTTVSSPAIRQSMLARVNLVEIKEKRDGITSRTTNRPYTYRKRNAVSSPIGQATNNTSFPEAKKTLTDELQKGARRVYFRIQQDIPINVAEGSGGGGGTGT